MDNLQTLCRTHHEAKTATEAGGGGRSHGSQMSNAELGATLGLTESAASYLRRGKRFPSAVVRVAMVERLGAQWGELYAALLAGKDGRPEEWASYVTRLVDHLSSR